MSELNGREREVAKKRRAALREERKRRQKKLEEAALEAEQDALVLQEFQEREVQLEAAMAVRLEKYEARRKRGLRAQARVQARVERRTGRAGGWGDLVLVGGLQSTARGPKEAAGSQGARRGPEEAKEPKERTDRTASKPYSGGLPFSEI